MPAIGAGHAREQKGTGIGSLLVPEQNKKSRPHGGFMPSGAPTG